MSHQRIAIRAAAKAALIDKTVAESRVWVNRPNPLSQRPGSRSASSELPAILIYTKDEQSDVFNAAPRQYRRTVELIVELAMAMSDTIDDDLDGFAYVVENLLLQDDGLDGAASETRLASSSMTIVDTGDIPIGAVVMTFEVDYYQYFPAEYISASAGDFETLATTTSINGEQSEDDRKGDTISIPQD